MLVEYQKVKSLIEHVNDCASSLNLLLICQLASRYCLSFSSLVKNASLESKLIDEVIVEQIQRACLFVYYCFIVYSLMVAAEAHANVSGNIVWGSIN